MTTKHRLYGHPDMREVRVPVSTVWTSPEAPRELDASAVADVPDMAAWTAELDAEGTMERRHGLHGRTLTQLLLGEPVLVLEQRGDWTRVAALAQRSSAHEEGYPGWIRSVHLGTPVDRVTGASCRVSVRTTTCKVEDGSAWELSCGTILWLEDVTEESATVALPDGLRGQLPLSDVSLGHKRQQPTFGADDLLATARQFLGMRYLWGGTSAWGLDCSGLVNLTLRAHSVPVPRDAFDQAAAERSILPVPLDEVEPGDLYFFARPGNRVHHVGFATSRVRSDGSRTMLHAPESGHQHVVDEPMPDERVELLVSAGRIRKPNVGQVTGY
jgi:gamma-D-glutamyl-L-lysine dipeptidyl-peptidase